VSFQNVQSAFQSGPAPLKCFKSDFQKCLKRVFKKCYKRFQTIDRLSAC